MTFGILTTLLHLTDFNRSRQGLFKASAVYQQHTANTQATINSTVMFSPSCFNWFTSTDNNYNRKYLGKKVHTAIGAESKIPLISSMWLMPKISAQKLYYWTQNDLKGPCRREWDPCHYLNVSKFMSRFDVGFLLWVIIQWESDSESNLHISSC